MRLGPCRSCLLVVGVLALFIAAWTTSVYLKYSPLYAEASCGPFQLSIEHLTAGEWRVSLMFVMTTTCINPNKYALSLTPPVIRGRVLLGQEFEPIGYLTMQPSTVPANDFSSVRIDAAMNIDDQNKIGHVIGADVDLFMEMGFDWSAERDFLSVGPEVSGMFRRFCGVKLRASERQMSMIHCQVSSAGLLTPEFGTSLLDGPVSLTVEKSVLDKEEHDMTMSLGFAAVLCWILGPLVICGTLVSAMLKKPQGRLKRVDGEEDAVLEEATESEDDEEESEPMSGRGKR